MSGILDVLDNALKGLNLVRLQLRQLLALGGHKTDLVEVLCLTWRCNEAVLFLNSDPERTPPMSVVVFLARFLAPVERAIARVWFWRVAYHLGLCDLLEKRLVDVRDHVWERFCALSVLLREGV